MNKKTLRSFLYIVVACCVWFFFHIPAIMYGTHELPLHQSYIGDEQSPVNGALHVLKEKNPIGLRNLKTLYYGPVFAMVALPAVVGDFVEKKVSGLVQGGEEYKNFILFDWGGIVWKARFISVVTGFIGLLGLFMLLTTKTVNPTQNKKLALIGTLLLACNFYYFEYSSFFKHWVYLLTALLWQLYLLVKIHENPERAKKYFIIQGVLAGISFGISYLALLSQVLFIPSLIQWVKNRDKKLIKFFALYALISAIIAIGTMIWHPHAFTRILGLVTGDYFGLDTSEYSSESTGTGLSFTYYATILIVNHFTLFAAIGLYLFKQRKDVWLKKYLISSLIILFGTFYLVMGAMSHHESRYILPAITVLVTVSAVLFVRCYSESDKYIRLLTRIFLFVYIFVHCVSICAWLFVVNDGPVEEQVIRDAVEYQREHRDAKQLFLSWYIIGHVHTLDAYKNYATTFKKDTTNLYKTIFETEPNEKYLRLNIFYRHPNGYPEESLDPKIFDTYDRVVYQYRPNVEQDLEPDYLEVNLTRLWFNPEAFGDSYFVIKEVK